MMAPQFERARVLAQAIDVAANALSDPIEDVKVSRDRIFISAGRRSLELAYEYHNAYSENGAVMPGSGHWSVSIVEPTPPSRQSNVLPLLAVLLLMIEYGAVVLMFVAGSQRGGHELDKLLFKAVIPILGISAAVLCGVIGVWGRRPSWIGGVVAAILPLAIIVFLLSTVSH